MALGPRLDLRQTQTLVMTPQLQQAIKLLQMSNLELTTFIERELDQNPMLEREDIPLGPEPAADAPADGAAEGTGDMPTSLDRGGETEVMGDAAALYESGGAENVWDSEPPPEDRGPSTRWDTVGSGGSFDGAEPDIEGVAAQGATLREHLLLQLNVGIPDPVDRMIGLHLIDLLDEAGYVQGSLVEIGALLGCDVERVENALAHLQRFDPPGIFARNLAECLRLQLLDRGPIEPAMDVLLAHLDLLAKRDFAALRRVCRIGANEIAELVAVIKTLNPKPAAAFDAPPAQTVIPDVIVRQRAGGVWHIELNNDTLPRVLVNNRYYADVSRQARTKAEKEYLSERLQSANWLVRALHQRAQTILKVATEIVRLQDGFLVHGVEHLRPLTLRDVAEQVSVHESTVSRVTNGKYVATPRGVLELKYFFNGAVGAGDGADGQSAESIRFRIRSLIHGESVDQVLSDDQIAAILSRNGPRIARRTVAKYREAMQIPSSVQRRREQGLHAGPAGAEAVR
ncbi:MAG: RNA polymerase factor sigma-54 [Alphaproteobacteria bacterium]|nr:RNA polymerase factor sigma-54 [Alphaproteobacteria bacterium]